MTTEELRQKVIEELESWIAIAEIANHSDLEYYLKQIGGN